MVDEQYICDECGETFATLMEIREHFKKHRMKLMSEYDKEIPKEELKELSQYCIFCGNRISVTCGTPVVYWSGCCVGFQTPKTRFLMARKAHSWCYLNWLEEEKKIKVLK